MVMSPLPLGTSVVPHSRTGSPGRDLEELQVEKKKGMLAKDALYPYENIAQNTNVATVELMLRESVD